MSGGASLKEQNAWLVRAALLLHVIAFAYVAYEPFVLAQLDQADILQKLQGTLAPGAISLAIISLARLVFLGLVPARLRDRLIHWRWSHPLPGSRAFSKYGPADPRVDMGALERRHGPLPAHEGEQGALFYKVYSAHADSVGVLDAHKSYLAARDIGTINFLMFVLLPWFAYWATGDLIRSGIYAALLLLSYALTAISAQVYGTRLVENALAAACADRS